MHASNHWGMPCTIYKSRLKQNKQKYTGSSRQVACSLRLLLEAGSGDTGVFALPPQVAGDGLKLFDVHGAVVIGVKHLKDHPYILQSKVMVLALWVANMSKIVLLHSAEPSHVCVIVGGIFGGRDVNHHPLRPVEQTLCCCHRGQVCQKLILTSCTATKSSCKL